MTILVATPYLDEAERCHRVALMHDGRHSADRHAGRAARAASALQRLEVRRRRSAPGGRRRWRDAPTGIVDVQRFGDRLDVLVRDAGAGERAVRDALGGAGLAVDEMRAADARRSRTRSSPCCARSAARPVARRFPAGDHDTPAARGAWPSAPAACARASARFAAVKDVNLEVALRRGLRPARRQRRRQDDHDQDAVRPARADARATCSSPASAEPAALRRPCGSRSATCRRSSRSTTISPIDENLDFFAGVYGVPPERRAERRCAGCSSSPASTGRGSQLIGSLPGGWKQRVAFGAAIMHEPSVLFLDEPTSGVDPLARRAFWALINRLADAGTAILVTTHYLEEAEQCNRLGLMVAGELVAEGTPSGVKAAQGGPPARAARRRAAARRRPC